MADDMAASGTVVFVIPSDRGHLLYTFHLAAELHGRGYAVEYWSPTTAATVVPSFAKFHGLHEPGDDTFDRLTRTYCMVKSHGDTYEESDVYFQKEFQNHLVAEFGDPEKALAEVQGTREALIRLKQRVLSDDVALCVYDASHMYSWIREHCVAFGVPTLGLCPTPLWLKLGMTDGPLSPPGNLSDEPEYRAVRKHLDVPHRIAYTLLPELLEGCTIPEGRRVTGPVLPKGGDVPEEQSAAFASSDLRAWCDGADTPIVYMSFGSMARSGPEVQSAARRLLEAIAGGPWRVLVAAAPTLFEGADTPLPATVRVEAWVPQSAVLAHPKVKAFISHCGATSINEAVMHAVPIVAVPLFDDQRFNAPAVVACGAAVAELPKGSFAPEEAMAAVSRAVESEEAAAKALAVSKRLRGGNGLAALVEEAETIIAEAKMVE